MEAVEEMRFQPKEPMDVVAAVEQRAEVLRVA
jgi:hypothetical protein